MSWLLNRFTGNIANVKIPIETGDPGGDHILGSDVLATAVSAAQTATTAQNVANNALVNANSAQSTATSAVTTAGNAQSTANNATALANDITSKAALKVNPSFTGNVTVDQGSTASLQILGTTNNRGPQIDFIGPGGNKYIRTLTNGLEFINSVYNAVIARLDDVGNFTVIGTLFHQNGKTVANAADLISETTRATTIENNLTSTMSTKAPIISPTFSGQIQVATGENAQGIALYGGNAGRSGYVSFYSPTNIRLGYIGFIPANGAMNIQAEGGTTGVYLGGDLTVSGNIYGLIPALSSEITRATTVENNLTTSVGNAQSAANNAQNGVNVTYEIATRTKWLKDFGGVGDGVTDNTSAIQNAMNSGLLVLVGPGVYLTQQLTMNVSGSKLRGVGRGGPHDVAPLGPAGTIFKYIGPNGGKLVNMAAPTSGQKLTDMEFTGIELVSGDYPYSTAAGYGLSMSSVQNSLIDIFTFEFTIAALAMTVTPNLSEAGNCEGNIINLRFRQINTNGTALQLGGINNMGNTCHNLFPLIYGYIRNGIGIDFQDADNNQLQQVWVDRVSGGSGTNLYFRGGGGPRAGGSPALGGGRTNIIKQFSQSIDSGIIYSEGTETTGVTTPAYGNRIEVFDNANVGINSLVGTGASFFWSGNVNPIGMRDSNLNTLNGWYQHSNGLIEFWGTSNGTYGGGQNNNITVPFSASKIITVVGNALGQSSSQACCYNFGTNTFTLYSPVNAYYSWVGKALA